MPVPSQPFEGIRVVDWSTVAAAPSACQLFAVLGAEVIKVDHVVSKDLARNLLLPFMPKRFRQSGPDGKLLPSAVYDTVNRSKKHVALDVSTVEGMQGFHSLLETADVIVTNVPSKSQERLGLTPQKLRQRYPQLVFVHMQAWGNGGPDEERPGYDLGSFYAATGLARLFSPEGRFHVYPISFGDLSTGLNLFLGMVFAVLQQQSSGRGGLVDTSLYSSGIWAAMPHMLQGEPCSEDVLLTARDHFVVAAAVGPALAKALGDDPVQAARSLVEAELCQILTAAGVAHAKEVNAQAKHFKELPPDIQAVVLPASTSVGDVTWDSPFPFAFHDHAFDIRQAPLFSEHQEMLGALPRDRFPGFASQPLIVIEIGTSPAIGCAGRMLGALGCEVFRVEGSPEPTWTTQHAFVSHLRHGKRSISMEEAILMPDAIIITDFEESALPVESAVVRLSGNPLADWYVRSGMASLLRGSDPSDEVKPLPTHVADASVGAALACCVAVKFFSRAAHRPIGNGAVSYLNVGLYLIQQQGAIMQASPFAMTIYGGLTGWNREVFRRAWPVPSASAFRTTDGHWVQNLGVDTPTHLPMLLRALPGSKFQVALGLPWAVLAAVVKLTTWSAALDVLKPFLEAVNSVILKSFESMSLAQFEDWAAKAGWTFYAVIRRTAEARDDANTAALGCISQIDGADIGEVPINVVMHEHLEARL